jgi:NAD(P)H-dependent flavin oxidoreductase YrpB (nitropropane dioxygenase family)
MLITRFTKLVGCSVPLQQAGMGGMATPGLAAAVSNAGGLGMLGAAGVPAPVLRDLLDDTRNRTSGTFGVNFLMPFLDRSCVEVAAKGARVVEFFYGAPISELVDLVHRGGALACWQVGSRDEAVAAADVGCDLIVAQGIEAGGHIRGQSRLLPLLDQVLRAVSVPVVAAGGIGTGEAMAAALSAGADAVRVGTRFVAASESPAHPRYVAALIGAEAEDTLLSETFSVGWPDAPHRVLRSAAEKALAYDQPVVGESAPPWDPSTRAPIARLSSHTPTTLTSGIVEAMSLWAGESVGAVRQVQDAGAIVQELLASAERVLPSVTGESLSR